MNIILDVTRLTRRIAKKQMLTGIDRVSLAYVKHFQDRAQALVRLCGINLTLSKKNSQKLFKWILNPQNKQPKITFLQTTLNNINIQTGSILLNTGHIGIKQKNYIKMLKKHKLRPIFFVHDLIPINYPEYCSPGEDVRHINKINYILKYGSGVITNSQATLDDLTKYCKSESKAMLPATVAKLTTSLQDFKKTLPPLKKPYFVMVSTIESRKNHLLILQIFRKLYAQDPENTPHLYIIGKRGWECEQVCDLLDRSISLKNCVTEVTNCPDEELSNYISHCQALLFPSFAEGYGLPVIEAVALGVPVIASDLEVFKEIVGDIPEYADPIDSNAWLKLITEYASPNSKMRSAQLQRLQDYKIPRWDTHFAAVDKFLETTS